MMKSMRSWIALVAVAVLSLGFEANGRAVSNTVANIAASTCTPANATIQSQFTTSTVSISNASGNSDAILFQCAIHEGGSTAGDTLLMRYQDGTTTAGNFVRTTYYRHAQSSGTLTQIVQLDSDADCSGTGTQTCSKTYSHTQDFANNAYYIRVDIDRSSSFNIERLDAIVLYDVI